MREADIFRQKIFDLAIHGRLTKRDKGDEPVEALLSRIAEAKRAYIAANKAKSEELDQISFGEVPFELPRGWVWCRLGEIAYVASGSTPPKSCFAKSGVPYIKMYNVRNQAIDFDFKPQYVTADTHNRLLKRSRAGAGDLLMNIVGPPLGKLAIIPDNLRECNFNQAAVVIRPYAERETINRYLYYYLWQMDEINSLDTRGTAGQANISLTQCKNLRIPLPPHEEQKRIVARVDELLDAVNRYSAAMGKISNAANLMEQKVLELAIRGKLSKREKGDGSAAALLVRIKSEKQKREASSCRARARAVLPPVTDDEKVFELPEGWEWCRLGDIGEIVLGKMLNRNVQDGKESEYLCTINVKWGSFDLSQKKKMRFKGDELKYYDLHKGDLLVCEGGDVGRCAVWQSDESYPFQNSLHRIRMFEVMPEYIQMYIHWLGVTGELQRMCSGVTIKHFTISIVSRLPIPLPPLAEQKRIVERVDAILAECRKMRGE